MSQTIYAVIGTYPFPNTPDDNGEHVISAFSTAEKAAKFSDRFKLTEKMEDYTGIHVEAWTLDEDEDLDVLYRVHYHAPEVSTELPQGKFYDEDRVELSAEVPTLDALIAMGEILAIGYGRTREAALTAATQAATKFYALPITDRPRFD